MVFYINIFHFLFRKINLKKKIIIYALIIQIGDLFL